jgi:exodeoxyribonuclease V alpha subunit
MAVALSGQIEHITYTHPETGFTIAKVKVAEERELVTVVGNLLAPSPGEILRMQGEWHQHPKFGRQFNIGTYQTEIPVTAQGIRKYLGSGLVKGLGPAMADRIVDTFGVQTLDIIEKDIQRLLEVDGIGPKRVAMIQQAWDEQREIRNVMVFLQGFGVSTAYASKIFQQYGQRSVAVLRQNPYRLAGDILGIGFKIADRIATQLGFPHDAPQRAEAGLLYLLDKLTEEGHVFYPYLDLAAQAQEILQVASDTIRRGIADLALARQIVIEDLNPDPEAFEADNKAVFLQRYHFCETSIANRLSGLMQTPKTIRTIDVEQALDWVQQRLTIQLAPKQVEALQQALQQKVLVITGGPGTGKTTIINAMLKIFTRITPKILLAAPTGRAAKRMHETTGHPARTIHRMLEFSPAKGGFQRNAKNPLPCDLLIVDEASMIDTILMHHLLKALPIGATLVLVGDVNQLPSVGAGTVLKDIIASDAFPVITLNEIFRQARQSQIVVNAHLINQGQVPQLPQPATTGPRSDFYFIEQQDPQKVVDLIIELVGQRIPRRFGLNPMQDIQVMAPMHKGLVGAENLNLQLQAALNPGQGGVLQAGQEFRSGDKVMQVKNNYEKAVFNGDIGQIRQILPSDSKLVIAFEGRDIAYETKELDQIILAYAISVHKSQGSEYPAVVIPVLTQHYVLLQRNLLYTAVTRGRELVVLVGSRQALSIGVNNNQTQRRYTRLRHRLRA